MSHASTFQTVRNLPYETVSPGFTPSGPTQFSPDGTKIAFESDRSGYQEIWVCNRDGANPAQITSMACYAGTPRWSPDSRLAFDFRPKDHSEIYVVEVPSGMPRRIATVPRANNVVPSWSQDGQWVYFASRGGGNDFQVWKVPIEGRPPCSELDLDNQGIVVVKNFH
jgi:Tol biopolymer transport system component